jgi:hypothetical protein
MRGRRGKQTDEEVQTEGDAVEVIDVSTHEPRRIPSKKWRELIKKVWEVDSLRCPKCSREMHIVSLIDQEDVIERILRHLGLRQEGVRAFRHRPAGRNDARSVAQRLLPRLRHRTGRGVLRHLKVRQRPSAPLAPLVQRPPALLRPCLTSGPTLSLCAHGNAPFRLQTPGQRPGGSKAISYQSTVNLKVRLILRSGLTR